MDVYPAIDIKNGQCVRLEQGQFDAVTTYSADPVEVARRWRDEGARWIHVVDLDAARTGVHEAQNAAVVRKIVSEVGVPVQFGGGVRTLEAAERVLGMGVTRVVVGTAAARDAALAQSLFAKYGDRVAVGVDAKDGIVAVHGWQEASGEPATDFVRRMAELGATRFIFTDIARDGMLQGVNEEALREVAAAAPTVAFTASGGVATLDDIDCLNRLHATTSPNVDAVIIGKALYAGAVTLPEVLKRTAA